MKPPSARRMMTAMAAAQQAVAALPESAIDAQLRADTIEGQSEAFELMDRFAELVLADQALVEQARARALRLEKRADHHRLVIEQMLIALELGEPVERALYTASLTWRSHARITDESALPQELFRRAPDLKLINRLLHEGTQIPGAELGNLQPTLTIRTK